MSDPASLPRIGDLAPDFTAASTQSHELKFSEWQGDSWVVFFSHPADFTPVCSTELAEFERRAADFSAIGVKLLGLSVDSIHSHVAWLQSLREKLGIAISYPVVADLDTKVSQKYGMIHAGASSTATVRAVFVIDPKRIVRAVVYYPLNVGRSVEEVFRLVRALQTADRHACALPENWKPGGQVLVPPPRVMQDIPDRVSNPAHDARDFYLVYKDLPGPK